MNLQIQNSWRMSSKCSKSEMAYCLGFIVNHFKGGGEKMRKEKMKEVWENTDNCRPWRMDIWDLKSVCPGPSRSRHQDGIKSFYFIRGNASEKENRERARRLGELLLYMQVWSWMKQAGERLGRCIWHLRADMEPEDSCTVIGSIDWKLLVEEPTCPRCSGLSVSALLAGSTLGRYSLCTSRPWELNPRSIRAPAVRGLLSMLPWLPHKEFIKHLLLSIFRIFLNDY